MTTAMFAHAGQGILRHSRWDALLVALAFGQGFLVLAYPVVPVIALGLWWNSNTVAHHFVHTPFFQSRRLNRLFALYLTVLLGVPQTLWRERHLAHHAGVPGKVRLTRTLIFETFLVLSLWTSLMFLAPIFFATVYVPAYAAGLLLCSLHGYYEHASGATSHYGAVYNLLFFNDGYHIEHHLRPGLHWHSLPEIHTAYGRTSRWPAILRWLDVLSLEGLERLVLRCVNLQTVVLKKHERAFRVLLPRIAGCRQVAIVGGGLYPRTALILKKLLPQARLTVIDASAENLAVAQELVQGIDFIHAWYDPARHRDFDLLVIPLSFVGDRQAIYRRPPAPAVIVHDWIWCVRRPGAVVSWFLLKRLNLVMR
jgi:Fatty acid desaturase